MGQKLTKVEVTQRLAELNAEGADWALVAGKLQRTFQFTDFVAAFAFMTRCALIAERMNHHPEWFNVYRTVRVELTTHDARGLTARDFALAQSMNEAASATAG
ncbi:MAG: 4a-hydroxytetrahydrobiopterin dehydratase [Pseudomonadales bacterium]|nr:4a-hydroxytetrahydrobiopterin dehydratase [Pseudomonadales bacterium]